MKSKELIDTYFKERMEKDHQNGGYPFVTISRQAGAGGHSVAQSIIDRLNDKDYADLYRGWQVFDQSLCEIVAQEPDLHVSLKSLLDEEYHSEFQDIMNELLGKASSQLTVYKRVCSIIKTLASVGKVIIVGRAANCITADMAAGIDIRLVAPEQKRIEQMAAYLGVSPDRAYQLVHKQDRDREKLVYDFYTKDINDSTLYDMVWNTDRVTTDLIVSSVVDMIEIKALQTKPHTAHLAGRATDTCIGE